jgi:hypothetical protein
MQATVEVLVDSSNGLRVARPVESIVMNYTVDHVGAWLGHFTPHQCRGFMDYLADRAFVASHLPIGEVPFERDSSWEVIEVPSLVATRLKGTFVTTENYRFVIPGSGNFKFTRFDRIGD